MAEIKLTVNGTAQTADVDPEMPLLFYLMDDLKLNGPKFGCGLAQCGACTVMVNGEATRSCTYPCSDAAGKNVMTIEGLGTPENPHALQKLFIEEQAVQCGFCISGVMLHGKELVDKNPRATRDEIIAGLNGVMCRCYVHARMVRALERYAEGLRK
jgi:nicotinate dehydrogenase subunit A